MKRVTGAVPKRLEKAVVKVKRAWHSPVAKKIRSLLKDLPAWYRIAKHIWDFFN